MAANLLTELSRLEGSLVELTKRVRDLEKRNRELLVENSGLQKKLRETEEENHRLSLDAQFLAVSYKLADSPDSLHEARRRISNLIRNIDRCLEMLKE